jgi:hypothetical protein
VRNVLALFLLCHRRVPSERLNRALAHDGICRNRHTRICTYHYPWVKLSRRYVFLSRCSAHRYHMSWRITDSEYFSTARP